MILICFAYSKRDISNSNFQMHVVHCQRNIQLCPKCQEPVPRSELDNHDLEFHSEVKCSDCQKTYESSSLNDHKVKLSTEIRYRETSTSLNLFIWYVFQANDCPKRQKQCQYCNLELKADTMDEHEDYCGSRTENCEVCDKLVMLKYEQMHLESGHRKIRPDRGHTRYSQVLVSSDR